MLPHAPLDAGLDAGAGRFGARARSRRRLLQLLRARQRPDRAADGRRVGQGRRRRAAHGEHPGVAEDSAWARVRSLSAVAERARSRHREATRLVRCMRRCSSACSIRRRACCDTSTPATIRNTCCAATADSSGCTATGLPVGLLAGRGYTERTVQLRATRSAVLLHGRLRRGRERARRDVRRGAPRDTAARSPSSPPTRCTASRTPSRRSAARPNRSTTRR